MVNTREIAEEYRLSHWAVIMREQSESGLSIKAYCKQIGISTNTYHYWQKKLRLAACEKLSTVPQPSGVFTQVALTTAVTVEQGNKQTITIEIGKGRVEVTNYTDLELLTKTLQVLLMLC